MGAMISYGPSLVLAGSVIGSSLRRKLYGLRYRFASSLQVRSPVDDERERRGVSFLSCVNEKAFPVARYVIMVARWIRRMDVEQGFGICDLERCTLHVDPHRHYFVLGAKEKNFLPITTPSRFAASIARNLPFTARYRKRRNVDLIASGFVRDVSDPTTVGRKLSVAFVSLRLQKWKRFAVPGHRQDPHIVLCVALDIAAGKRYEPPVCRPRCGRLIFFRLQKQLIIAGSARDLLIEIVAALSI